MRTEVSALSTDVMWKTLGLSAIAGLRTMSAPAILSRSIMEGRLGGMEGTPFAVLGSSAVSKTLQMMAVGEMIADKLPVLPGRTSAPLLLGRAASGALVGAALFVSTQRRAAAGGVLGAAAAVVSAYAGERLRLQIGSRFGVPDPLLALLEDGLILSYGAHLLQESS